MFCPKCGSKNPDLAKFCEGCGLSLVKPTSTSSAPLKKPIREKKNISFSAKAKVISAIMLVIFIFAGVGTAYYFLRLTTKIVTSYEVVRFETVTKEDANLLEGLKYTKQTGQDGNREIKTKLWLNRDGIEKKRKVVSKKIVKKPINTIIMAGARPKTQVIEDVKAVMQKYMDAWKAKDYGAVFATCISESISGYDVKKVQQSYAITGQVLESYQIAEPEVVKPGELKQTTNEEDGSESVPDKPAYITNAPVIADLPLTYTVNSSMFGRTNIEKHCLLALVNNEWKVIYFGQCNAISVNKTKEKKYESSYSTDPAKVQQTTIAAIVIFPDHTIVVVRETNKTVTPENSWSTYSVTSNFTNNDKVMMKDDLMRSYDYTYLADKSSRFEHSSLDAGISQGGYLYFEPGVPANANSLSYSIGDVEFAGIKIP